MVQTRNEIDVDTYINLNIYQSKVWDTATDLFRTKAINQAERTLKRMLPIVYESGVPVEHLAEQVIWLMKIDDSFQRAELGASNISLDGISISIKDKDRTLAPFILEVNRITPDGITGGMTRRKVGRYSTSISDSHRKGW